MLKTLWVVRGLWHGDTKLLQGRPSPLEIPYDEIRLLKRHRVCADVFCGAGDNRNAVGLQLCHDEFPFWGGPPIEDLNEGSGGEIGHHVCADMMLYDIVNHTNCIQKNDGQTACADRAVPNPPIESKTGVLLLGQPDLGAKGSVTFGSAYFAPTSLFPPQKMPEFMILEYAQLEENGTINDGRAI